MNEKEKNVTNDNFQPYIELKRVEVKELKNKQGDTYYMLSGLYDYKDRTVLITLYFKDKSLYSELLEIPNLHLFKLYYEVGVDLSGDFRIVPIACSL